MKQGTAIGYLINPHDKTVSIVTLPLIDDNVPISRMYELLDCDLVDVAHMPGKNVYTPGFDLWIDDEGLYRAEQAYFYVTHPSGPAYGSRMFVGKALVLGTDAQGNTVGTSMSLDALAKRIVWAHPEDAARDAEQALASISVTSYDSMDDLLAALAKKGVRT